MRWYMAVTVQNSPLLLVTWRSHWPGCDNYLVTVLLDILIALSIWKFLWVGFYGFLWVGFELLFVLVQGSSWQMFRVEAGLGQVWCPG